MTSMQTGAIVWFDPKHGCGAIADDGGREVFLRLDRTWEGVHAPLAAGQRYGFQAETCERLGRDVVVELCTLGPA